MELGSFKKV